MSKLLIFIVVVIIIYYLANNIKVIHQDALPIKEQTEIKNRQKIRSMLLQNHIKHHDKDNVLFESFSETSNPKDIDIVYNQYLEDETNEKYPLPNASELISIIKAEYVDTQYRFNIANLPETSRYPNRNTKHLDNKYIRHIKNNILEWNDILKKNYSNIKNPITVDEIKPIFITETADEFVIDLYSKLKYLDKTLHLRLKYYGEIERSDDFINHGSDIYILQLTSIRPVTSNEYNHTIQSVNQKYNDISGPFMSMDEQMNYVRKINKMHQDELGY